MSGGVMPRQTSAYNFYTPWSMRLNGIHWQFASGAETRAPWSLLAWAEASAPAPHRFSMPRLALAFALCSASAVVGRTAVPREGTAKSDAMASALDFVDAAIAFFISDTARSPESVDCGPLELGRCRLKPRELTDLAATVSPPAVVPLALPGLEPASEPCLESGRFHVRPPFRSRSVGAPRSVAVRGVRSVAAVGRVWLLL